MAQGQGFFLPTTYIFDMGLLHRDDFGKKLLSDLFVQIAQNFSETNRAVNSKTNGEHPLAEVATGNTYFKNPAFSSTTNETPTGRGSFRTTVNFGALPNTSSKSVAHNIDVTSDTIWVKWSAMATDTSSLNGIPIPFVDVSGTFAVGDIELFVDATNVTITTTGSASNFNECVVTLEYLQS